MSPTAVNLAVRARRHSLAASEQGLKESRVIYSRMERREEMPRCMAVPVMEAVDLESEVTNGMTLETSKLDGLWITASLY
jgi:hypothetical protein